MIHNRQWNSVFLGSATGLCICALSAFAEDPLTAPAGPLRGHGFQQVGIQVDHVDRTIRFYRDTLGLKLLFTANGMIFFDAGGARLMVERGHPSRSTTIYFDDSNLERDKVLLEAKGVRFRGPIETVQRDAAYDLKLVEFADPDGNPLALMGKVAHNASPRDADAPKE